MTPYDDLAAWRRELRRRRHARAPAWLVLIAPVLAGVAGGFAVAWLAGWLG